MSGSPAASPPTPRRILLLLAGAAAAGIVLFLVADRYSVSVRDWILSDPERAPARLRLVLALLGAAATAPLVAFAGYMWVLGARTVRARQFPPPGAGPLREVPVVAGDAALRRGRLLVALAAALALCCLLLLAMLWRLGASLGAFPS